MTWTDTFGLVVTTTVLFMLGIFMPYIVASFSSVNPDVASNQILIGAGQTDLSDITFIQLATSITTMFFWTYGIVNPVFWVEAILEVIRIIFYITFFRTIRGN